MNMMRQSLKDSYTFEQTLHVHDFAVFLNVHTQVLPLGTTHNN